MADVALPPDAANCVGRVHTIPAPAGFRPEIMAVVNDANALLCIPKGQVTKEQITSAMRSVAGALKQGDLSIPEENALQGAYMSAYGRGNVEGLLGPDLSDIMVAIGLKAMLWSGGGPSLPGKVALRAAAPLEPPPPPVVKPRGMFIARLFPKYERRQLQIKYKHAKDFGVDSTKNNPQTQKQFADKINEHIGDPDTVAQGTYVRSPGSTVYFNPNTLNVVVVGADNYFVTAFTLDPVVRAQQYLNYLKNGALF